MTDANERKLFLREIPFYGTNYTGCLKKNATEIKQTVVHHKRG